MKFPIRRRLSTTVCEELDHVPSLFEVTPAPPGRAMIEATLIIMLFLTIVFSIFNFAFVTFQH